MDIAAERAILAAATDRPWRAFEMPWGDSGRACAIKDRDDRLVLLALPEDAALGSPAPAPRLDRLDIDAMAFALEARDVQRGGSPHITPGNRFYREEAAALLALVPPRADDHD